MATYSPYDNFCEEAQNKQSVLSAEAVRQKYPDFNNEKIFNERSKCSYSCEDTYEMGTIQDNNIYISTSDKQHDQICRKEAPTADGGISGYFTDQATVDACSSNGTLDNTALNDACQIKPYRSKEKTHGDATYKSHVDCFEINRDKLQEHYGTKDFNAAISKCEANNQFGAGGGNQGYNPHISEMIEKECLIHNPEKGYSDSSISRSENLNANQLDNSVVPEKDYKIMMDAAYDRTQDCIQNNTPHPSASACENGFQTNPSLIESNTGHAIPIKDSKQQIPGNEVMTDDQIKALNSPGNQPPKHPVSEIPSAEQLQSNTPSIVSTGTPGREVMTDKQLANLNQGISDGTSVVGGVQTNVAGNALDATKNVASSATSTMTGGIV